MAAFGSRMRPAERWAAIALAYTALGLTILEYLCLPGRVEALRRGLPRSILLAPSLDAGLIWSGATTAVFLLGPLFIVLFGHGEPLSSIGYRSGGFLRHSRIYVALYALMLPVILVAARRPEFQSTYPFVREATTNVKTFVLWEFAYLAQFFALESFFRGYLLFTLERQVGRLAIFAMTVPYAMIHFHKPLAEALGAIIAGIVLGALALRYRSFYGGALLHGLVAATMDVLAARRAGLFD